jgi:transposase-like protein
MVERFGNQMARTKVRQSVQAGVIKNIVEMEVSSIIAEALNERLKAEQEVLLGRSPYERQEGSPSRNGFKKTWLSGLFGGVMLKKPVVRRGPYSSPLLRALKQAGRVLRNGMAIRFWLRGGSTRAVAREINATMGTKLSHSTVSELTNALEPMIREWETRPIPKGIVYLFPDALYLPVRRPGFTKEQAILLALGVDATGMRHLLGFMLGDRESEDSWSAFFKDLLKRGLDLNALRLAVSDEHKGIESAVSKVLGVPHQFCVVHKIRNLRARVASPDWKAFLADLNAIYWAPNREEAKRAAGVLQGRWLARYPKAVSIALNRLDDFLRFMDEPKNLWTLLRTSNLIERFIREMRRRLRPAGAMHSELEVSKIVWSVGTEQERRWKGRKWMKRGTSAKVLVQAQEAMA